MRNAALGELLRWLSPGSGAALTGKRWVALFRYTLRMRAPLRERRKADKMRRTLSEWEKLWRERWDSNDYADLDSVFADTQGYKDVLCEVEIIINTREGRIETVQISLLDSEFTVLADYEYSIYELGRVELVQAVIASINIDPEDEDEEGEEAETLPESNS
jgi:hypothetical protein